MSAQDEERKLHPQAEVQKNHPLSLMVEHERENLLMHPLVLQLLKHKRWHSFGGHIFYFSLLLHTLFLTFFTTYIVTARPPYFRMAGDADFCSEKTDQSIVNDGFSKEATLNLAIVTIVLSSANLIKEVNQRHFTFVFLHPISYSRFFKSALDA